MFKPQYSGERSRKIWEEINNLPIELHEKFYACFVLLQDMEATCLCWLNDERV